MTEMDDLAPVETAGARQTVAARPTGLRGPGVRALRVLRSPTGSRYVLLVGVLLLAGAFAGRIVHNQFFGISWAKKELDCSREAERRYPGDALAGQMWQARCAQPAARRMTAVSLSGSAAVLLISTGGLWVLPRWALRRAGPLKPAPAGMQEWADREVDALSLRSQPRIVEAADGWEEPFTAGPPGAPVVVLPAGVGALAPETAKAIIRHEFAHVAAGDVRLVWLVRSTLVATVAVLAAPVLSAAMEMRSTGLGAWGALVHPFWGGGYAVRSLLLLAAVFAISQMVLRSREHEADILSVVGRSRAGLTAMLAGAERTQRIRGAFQGWWSAPDGPRSVLANHPSPTRRMEVLRQPHPHLKATCPDAAVTGLLSALAFASVSRLAMTAFPGTPLASYTTPAVALVVGVLMAPVWGTQVWQDAMDDVGTSLLPTRVLAALGVGTALGILAPFDDTGYPPAWNAVAIVPPAVCVAAALSAVLARAYASAARPGRHRARSRSLFVAALAVNAALFVGALRTAQELALYTSLLPHVSWAWLTLPGIHSPHSGSDAVVVGFLALLALGWSLRSASVARAGAGSAPETAWRLALPSGVALAAAAGALAARWVSRHDQAQAGFVPTLQYDRMAAAAAGLVCLLALCSVRGRAGLGPGLWAAPLTTVLTTGVLWTVRMQSLASGQAISRVGYFADPLAQLAVLGGLVVIPLALLPARDPAPAARFLVPCLGAYGAALLTAALVRTDCIMLHL
ncbi:M48 family metalloprotease [Streptomyces sp. NBC_01443]|uniref:M48 family metalloprotease n=1 Tax=Streptomyces sp. NBC_01443 TaxID=2903868 RepID=UPI0022569A50|nr:M48 family metalloprotease [Streptomyces sp. NBC_01443]MCX4633042.1 M48 family metalloprotease [Streptomyces sp. NBC_01443]